MTANLDPYLYPGTAVLRNLYGLREADAVQRLETRSANQRIAELIQKPLQGKFDPTHLKAIHRYIFQDVYDWAGEFRTVNISKGGHLFAMAQFLDSATTSLLAKLPGEDYLKNLDRDRFAVRAAWYLSEINAAHPFREGNGRTQREFIRELGIQAGHRIDWSATTRDKMIEASRVGHSTGDASLFRELILNCLGA